MCRVPYILKSACRIHSQPLQPCSRKKRGRQQQNNDKNTHKTKKCMVKLGRAEKWDTNRRSKEMIGAGVWARLITRTPRIAAHASYEAIGRATRGSLGQESRRQRRRSMARECYSAMGRVTNLIASSEHETFSQNTEHTYQVAGMVHYGRKYNTFWLVILTR